MGPILVVLNVVFRGDAVAALLFSFEGRIGRASYWIGQILVGVLSLPAAYLFFKASDWTLDWTKVDLQTWLIIAAMLAPITYMQFAIAGKRWHDRDKSAWWGCVFFIPFIGSIWYLLELGLLAGSKGDNRYGPPPA